MRTRLDSALLHLLIFPPPHRKGGFLAESTGEAPENLQWLLVRAPAVIMRCEYGKRVALLLGINLEIFLVNENALYECAE